MPQATMSFSHERRARFVECDPQSRVNNCHYLSWIDDATVEWLRSCGDLYESLHERGCTYVVAHATVRYLHAVRFDDCVRVAVHPRVLGATSLIVGYAVRVGGAPDRECARAEVRYVCIDARSERPVPWPDPFAGTVARLCKPPSREA